MESINLKKTGRRSGNDDAAILSRRDMLAGIE